MVKVRGYGIGCVVRGERSAGCGTKEGKSEATMWAFPKIFIVLFLVTEIRQKNVAV